MSELSVVEPDSKTISVLKAATSVFLAHGFSAATTDMIQREAGISKATLYACFPNKESVFAAAIERECATMAATIRAIEIAPGDIARTLTEIGMSYLKIVLSPTGLALYRVIVAETPRFPELGRRFYLAGPTAAASVVAKHLTRAMQAGEVNVQAIGVEAAATLFINMVRSEGQMECLTHPDAQASAVQVDRWVQVAVTTFLGAFGPR